MYDLNPKSIIIATLYCNQTCWITEMLLNILILLYALRAYEIEMEATK